MTKRKWIIVVAALVMIAGGAGVLSRLQTTQKLGRPGVKTSLIPGSHRLQVELPQRVLDYDSKLMPTEKMVLDFLPQDTSFGQRMYRASDGLEIQVNAVLMGTDRTSLHKPEFCLGGAGWRIEDQASVETTVPISRPFAYPLPVKKLVATKEIENDGRKMVARGIYVYWFVEDEHYTARHWQRMWWMAKDMLGTGKLQRWAYISYFAVCAPGSEEATFERMKTMIAASVPEFQLTPRAPGAVLSAR